MTRYLSIALCTLLFHLPLTSVAANCSGSTEEMLECHSPEVKRLLADWVRAWADGDIDAYFAFYTSARSPRSDMSRTEWESHRRARVQPGRDIKINLRLDSLGLEDSGLVDVVFDQHYKSPTFEDMVTKRLFLIQEGGRFKIWKEEVLK